LQPFLVAERSRSGGALERALAVAARRRHREESVELRLSRKRISVSSSATDAGLSTSLDGLAWHHRLRIANSKIAFRCTYKLRTVLTDMSFRQASMRSAMSSSPISAIGDYAKCGTKWQRISDS
jgi:hypothetical protein